MALRNQARLAALLIGALAGGTEAADAGEHPPIAFFGFRLINTSLEPTKPVEEARLQMLDVLLLAPRVRPGSAGDVVARADNEIPTSVPLEGSPLCTRVRDVGSGK